MSIIVTPIKHPSAIIKSLYLPLITPEESFLITAKSNSLEIFAINSSGSLNLVHKFLIQDFIINDVQPIYLPDSRIYNLIVLTRNLKLIYLQFNESTQSLEISEKLSINSFLPAISKPLILVETDWLLIHSHLGTLQLFQLLRNSNNDKSIFKKKLSFSVNEQIIKKFDIVINNKNTYVVILTNDALSIYLFEKHINLKLLNTFKNEIPLNFLTLKQFGIIIFFKDYQLFLPLPDYSNYRIKNPPQDDKILFQATKLNNFNGLRRLNEVEFEIYSYTFVEIINEDDKFTFKILISSKDNDFYLLGLTLKLFSFKSSSTTSSNSKKTIDQFFAKQVTANTTNKNLIDIESWVFFKLSQTENSITYPNSLHYIGSNYFLCTSAISSSCIFQINSDFPNIKLLREFNLYNGPILHNEFTHMKITNHEYYQTDKFPLANLFTISSNNFRSNLLKVFQGFSANFMGKINDHYDEVLFINNENSLLFEQNDELLIIKVITINNDQFNITNLIEVKFKMTKFWKLENKVFLFDGNCIKSFEFDESDTNLQLLNEYNIDENFCTVSHKVFYFQNNNLIIKNLNDVHTPSNDTNNDIIEAIEFLESYHLIKINNSHLNVFNINKLTQKVLRNNYSINFNILNINLSIVDDTLVLLINTVDDYLVIIDMFRLLKVSENINEKDYLKIPLSVNKIKKSSIINNFYYLIGDNLVYLLKIFKSQNNLKVEIGELYIFNNNTDLIEFKNDYLIVNKSIYKINFNNGDKIVKKVIDDRNKLRKVSITNSTIDFYSITKNLQYPGLIKIFLIIKNLIVAITSTSVILIDSITLIKIDEYEIEEGEFMDLINANYITPNSTPEFQFDKKFNYSDNTSLIFQKILSDKFLVLVNHDKESSKIMIFGINEDNKIQFENLFETNNRYCCLENFGYRVILLTGENTLILRINYNPNDKQVYLKSIFEEKLTFNYSFKITYLNDLIMINDIYFGFQLFKISSLKYKKKQKIVNYTINDYVYENHYKDYEEDLVINLEKIDSLKIPNMVGNLINNFLYECNDIFGDYSLWYKKYNYENKQFEKLNLASFHWGDIINCGLKLKNDINTSDFLKIINNFNKENDNDIDSPNANDFITISLNGSINGGIYTINIIKSSSQFQHLLRIQKKILKLIDNSNDYRLVQNKLLDHDNLEVIDGELIENFLKIRIDGLTIEETEYCEKVLKLAKFKLNV